MKTYRYTLIGILCFVAPFASTNAAPDVNGYEAQYECRAGNPNCDVDVAGLAAQSCGQIIEPSTSWASIDWNNDIICLRTGDHSAKGALTITASGSVGARKILRCVTSSGAQCDDPWTTFTRANLRKLYLNGADYWIVDRLAFNQTNADLTDRVFLQNGANGIVLNRLLIEGGTSRQWYSGVGIWGGGGGESFIWVQNSVIRDNYGEVGNDGAAIASEHAQNIYVVNNEIYAWANAGIRFGYNGVPTLADIVVENNDIYASPSSQSRVDAQLSFKVLGEETDPIRVLNNRIWGTRATGSSDGKSVSITPRDSSEHQRWILLQDNVIYDTHKGIQWSFGNNQRSSLIGNVLYRVHNFGGGFDSGAIEMFAAGTTELYFNTIIDAAQYHLTYIGGDGNNDIRSNLFVSSNALGGGAPDSGTHVDHNTFYNTTPFSYNASGTYVHKAVSVRTDSAPYAEGAVVYRNADPISCTASNDPDCFLYIALNSGTTGSNPSYATSLGGTFVDGEITWRAIRGPYTVYRKLRTSPEELVIPYARVHSSAPEVGLDAGGAGARSGIGINDDPPSTGILAADAKGTARAGTPGAFEAGGGGSPPSPPPGQTPYLGSAFVIPGTIQAEDYDTGGQDVAFNDTTLANEGGAYRIGSGDGVDIEITQDTGGGHDVGWVTPGEWLEYTVNAETTGTYDIEIRHASSGPGGTMHVEFHREGAQLVTTDPITLPDTGGWQTWNTTTVSGVTLTAGTQVMRLSFDSGNNGWLANINYINITPSGSAPPPPCYTPYLGAPITLPGIIEAENYDLGGEGCAYHDTSTANEPGAYRNDGVDIEVTQDTGGGYDVGWTTPGEWLQYSTDVTTAATYTLEVRYATQGFGGTMHVEFDGIDKTGSIALNDTGGWQTWGTVSVPVTLNAGAQVMRVVFDTAGPDGWLANINYIRITQGTPQPSLSGTLTTPSAIVNLTEGSFDWVHWGLNDASSVNRKSGVTPLISNYTPIGTGTVQQYNDNPSGFSWTDGTPTTNVTNTTTYLYVSGVGNGFEVSIPADTTLRTVKVYVGVWAAQGQLTATLSDNSAPSYTDSSLNHPTDHSHGVYTFQYRAASPGQSLVIRWQAVNSYHSQGSVTWQAVVGGEN